MLLTSGAVLLSLVPWPGPLPLDPAGGSAIRPRYRFALRTPHVATQTLTVDLPLVCTTVWFFRSLCTNVRSWYHTNVFSSDYTEWPWSHTLTPSTPAVPNCCCSKGMERHTGLTHHFNLWHSGALALSPERQSARMSQIKNGGLDQYGKV